MVVGQDCRSIPSKFCFRHEGEHCYQIESDEHGDNMKCPIDTEGLDDKGGGH